MKLLLIHAEKFEYEARQKALEAEELSEGGGRASVENALVCFTTVESFDEANPAWVVARAAEEIASVAERVGVRKVVLYPYAHLSSDLAKPRAAVAALRMLAAALERWANELHLGRGLRLEEVRLSNREGWWEVGNEDLVGEQPKPSEEPVQALLGPPFRLQLARGGLLHGDNHLQLREHEQGRDAPRLRGYQGRKP